jgi:predicted ATP-binding protein involved in virulence
MEKINSFKLIGIRPHKDCGEKYLKVLEPGRLYQFYNEYKFYTKDGKFDGVNGEITHYNYIQSVPKDLYNVGSLNVNISAVVGKNGTGKSSLIELLLYCIYFLGTKLKNEAGDNILHTYEAHIQHMSKANKAKIDELAQKRKSLDDFVNNCLVDLNIKDKNKAPERIEKYNEKLEDLLDLRTNLNDLKNTKTNLERDLELAVKEHKEIISSIKCSLIFEIDDAVFNMVIDNDFKIQEVKNENVSANNIETIREVKLITILNPESLEILNSFFYSIVLNYSHHSLNAKHLGFWINTLFHKNDGYKTPAVINPMRENGKFDINHENYLAKQRLLVNLLIDCLVNKNKNPLITEKQRVLKIRFTFNKNKEIGAGISVGDQLSDDPKDDFIVSGHNTTLLMKIHGSTFEENNLSIYDRALPFNQTIHNYIYDKSLKIQDQYPEYKVKWEDGDNVFSVTDKYVKYLIDDKSHITYKLKQALYFLGKTAKDKSSSTIWNESKEHFELTLDDLLSWMEISTVDDLENIFIRIPPSIFYIDFILDGALKDAEPPKFEDLSSGEQQKIHTSNTVIYHLNNLYSVHLAVSEKKRITYQYINVILDEIELYYHPDLQRHFVIDLMETLKTQKHLVNGKYIKALNFIFSTHSPFILSDIPSSNILRLEKGKLSEEDFEATFGANIHDLLANEFFLKKGFIGEFARQKIIEFYDELIKLKESNESISQETHESHKMKINLVGDIILKTRLNDILTEVPLDIEDLELQLQQAEKMVEILKMRLNG